MFAEGTHHLVGHNLKLKLDSSNIQYGGVYSVYNGLDGTFTHTVDKLVNQEGSQFNGSSKLLLSTSLVKRFFAWCFIQNAKTYFVIENT